MLNLELYLQYISVMIAAVLLLDFLAGCPNLALVNIRGEPNVKIQKQLKGTMKLANKKLIMKFFFSQNISKTLFTNTGS